jgi:hypothetical protein
MSRAGQQAREGLACLDEVDRHLGAVTSAADGAPGLKSGHRRPLKECGFWAREFLVNVGAKEKAMGLFDWLRRRESGDKAAKLVLSPEESEFAGLNMKQVLDAHLAWRARLENVLTGTAKEVIEVNQIAPDNLCVLGKWLYGPGKQQFGALREYEALRVTHKKFHMTAGQILVDFNAGNLVAANQLLKRDFRALSERVQLDLVRLYSAGT